MLHAMLTAVQDAAATMDVETAKNYLSLLGAGLGVGLTVMGAAFGIGKIGEAAGNIQTASIILAALIEGAALFGLVIALLFKLL